MSLAVNCNSSSEAMLNLPEELILEILLRLPVKSLLCFRSVSKSWLSLISDSRFAKSHFERSSMTSNRLVCIAASEALSIDFETSFYDDSSVIRLNFPLTPPYDIMGSCRGFLLLYNFESLFVWNPSSGVCRMLSSYCPISSATYIVLYGFGYDDSTDDYLVVLAFYDFVFHFEIFSLKSNSWKDIGGTHFPYIDAVADAKPEITLNGTMHWLLRHRHHDPSAEVILGFDLTARAFRELPMPDKNGLDLNFCVLGLLGRCLSLSIVDEDATEIWIMKEYGVKSSWAKSIIVSVEHVPNMCFKPICFTKGGDIIGRYDWGTGLMKCNCEGELLEHRSYRYGQHGIHIAEYTMSLLSLPS